MTRAALLLALLAACSPDAQTMAVQTATDLLTPAEARCEEARSIWDGFPPEQRTDLNAAYVAAACVG